ncbi:inositol polyphosphate multikinase [Nymphalis io]|uniref:inositol polyphosphate multikinase n=1 Tax=Inachis io TaxID=171585 RepID=UPI002167D906|nr:inositol polyphosphate multikinase [Nymphalis io]XP_050347567.1 inositol polyphosphate multikinase [Nymphalis io]
MSDVGERPKTRRPVRRQRSIYQVHYSLRPREDEMMAKPLAMPSGPLQVQAFELQVAGHKNDNNDTRYMGLLQCSNGRVLKPIIKECQKREVEFYSRVWSSNDPDLVELRKYIPKYYGCKKFTYNGYEQDYIMLEDLTERMLEPCIMDVKIGRRTWDPLATEEKIKKEQSKYKQCKEEYGFCIPGYQVYKLATGKLQKYNKEYGKKLHGPMVRTAIKNFLNGLGGSVCRALLLQQLSALWALQRWAARARPLALFAASLLLVYDAARLRACCDDAPTVSRMQCREPSIPRRKSIHSLHSPVSGSNFSGQISSKGPVYRKVNSVPISPMSLTRESFSSPPPIKSPWTEALEKLNNSHSFEHNYEDKLSKIKMNYRALLDQLSSDSPTPNPWGTVKIIDFVHAFFNDEEEAEVDTNFRDGINSLVEIFESLLRETDDQVF